MRWESLLLALVTQALQVGLKPFPSSVHRPDPPEVVVGADCHCSCYCSTDDWVGSAWGFGGVIGALGASVVCWCKGTSASPVSPHHRRRGHGFISEPLTWPDPRRLLQR